MKTFPASLDNLYPMLSHVRLTAITVGFSEENLSKIELALEEALVNIINYAYPDGKGTIEIRCTKVDYPPSIIVEVHDKGIPFNPLEFNMKSLPTDGVGGYGIFYIKQIMDEVQYEREGEVNVLRLRKYVS